MNKVQRKYIADSLPQFLASLQDYAMNEMAKLMAADKMGPAATLNDQVETIVALAEGADTIADINKRIATIFADNVTGVTLSSVHRAKGTEADSVYIIRPDLMPHPMAKTAWQREQEMNLKYVAITRAKRLLTIVNGC
jgi:superfamily I DNA/RNA helicase